MVGLRSGNRRYDIHVERLAERLEVPRGERDVALERFCQAYAERLAHYCTVAPFQWFNFYDFWLPGGVHADG
jgi:predicted LPLAT superfamily acyltransferase